jgi:hypothetical protein
MTHPTNALRKVINASIAAGNPPVTEQRPTRVTVTVFGVNGYGEATFPYEQWSVMSPVSRVLALHEACRDATNGKPFNVTHTLTR